MYHYGVQMPVYGMILKDELHGKVMDSEVPQSMFISAVTCCYKSSSSARVMDQPRLS